MQTMKAFYFIILILSLCKFIKNQDETNCNNRETCGECIQTLNCIWCTEPNSNIANGTLKIYCENRNNSDIDAWCPKDKIYAPEHKMNILLNEPLRSQNDENQDVIQIKPQKIQLSLRKGEEYSFDFQYRQAKNYPVDLYYIMDLSASMEPHREKLAQLGGKLAEAMRNLTNDFHIGFGSFVDKTDMPFISTVPADLMSPCKLANNVKCIPPYSFKNHMSLTFNDSAFSQEVLNAQVSGNLDFPEGGLDAVMQAMVCKNVIGWREKARHLIVFSTDADYHIAGDGKLAGVVEPNDAQCHMTNNLYTHDLIYDYPSISQINYVAKQNNINLIFAIAVSTKARVYAVYEDLQGRIENSVVGALTQNSANVVNLVRDNYNKIVDSVVITDNSGSEIEIKYSSNCLKPKENGCNSVHADEIIDFKASIRVLQCQPGASNLHKIKIKPEGIDESLELELEAICDCPCEQLNSNEIVIKSPLCANYGDLKCGVCSCYPGRFGRNCECDSTTSNSNDDSACTTLINDELKVCAGFGSCRCGKCECTKRAVNTEMYYGKFCECDNFSCKRDGGKICSGTDRGVCDCGACKCLAGWTGESCQCSDTNSTCVAPGTDSVCNGRGICSCGDCKCFNSTEGHMYSGKYCDECPSCPGQRCEELRHCVECQAFNTGSYSKSECITKCTSFTSNITEKIEDNDESDVKVCRIPDSSECTIIFQYTYNEKNELRVDVQKTKICSESVNLLALVLGVIGSIVLAGIVLLIVWKVFTVIHDRREYAKFENERANAKWHGGGNPLYKKATSEFKNPLYNN